MLRVASSGAVSGLMPLRLHSRASGAGAKWRRREKAAGREASAASSLWRSVLWVDASAGQPVDGRLGRQRAVLDEPRRAARGHATEHLVDLEPEQWDEGLVAGVGQVRAPARSAGREACAGDPQRRRVVAARGALVSDQALGRWCKLSARRLPLPAVRRGVLQAVDRRAPGHPDRQGFPAGLLGEGAGAQERSARLPGLRKGRGRDLRARPVRGAPLAADGGRVGKNGRAGRSAACAVAALGPAVRTAGDPQRLYGAISVLKLRVLGAAASSGGRIVCRWSRA
jgi:hypothetical protein